MNIKKQIIIYLIIILISLLPCQIMFNQGFVKGHDNAFHYAQIQDLYDKLINKDFFNYLNYEANHNFGMGVRLMYAPLSHLFVVLIGVLITPLGLTLTSAMKITIFLSFVFSGVFTYQLIKKITNNDIAALIGALFYILFPYRFTDVYIRNAFAETIAMAFIPLVFNGVYSVIKLKNFETKPFIILTLGAYFVFMTHTITAIYTFIFVIIFMLFFIKDLKYLLSKKYIWLSLTTSIFILTCLISPLLFPTIEHMSLGIYRIFDAEAMNTNLEKVMDSASNAFAYLQGGVTNKALISVCSFILISIFIYLINILYKQKNKLILLLPILGIAITLAWAVKNNINTILLFAILIEGIIILIPHNDQKTQINYYILLPFITLLIISFILCTNANIWKIMPTFLYNIQFSWRLWVFVGLFLAIIIALIYDLIISKYNYLLIKYVGVIIGCGMLVIIKPTAKDSYTFYEDQTIDITDTYYIYSCGWQLEYFPIEFYEGSKSSFFWKCYYTMLKETDAQINEIYVYSGKAKYANFKYNDGTITFDLETTTNSLIEVPRIYYLGYNITLTTNEGEVINLTPISNEGFLSFETNKSGTIEIKYIGTTLTNSSKYLALFGTTLLIIIPIYFKKRK